MKKKEIPLPIKLKSIIIWCPNLNEEVKLEENEYNIYSISQECETCGSHGSISIEVRKCKCNKFHDDLEIKSW